MHFRNKSLKKLRASEMVWWVQVPACDPDMNSIVAHKVKERTDSHQLYSDRHVLDRLPPHVQIIK